MKPSGKDSRSQLKLSWDHFQFRPFTQQTLANETKSPKSYSGVSFLIWNEDLRCVGRCDRSGLRLCTTLFGSVSPQQVF